MFEPIKVVPKKLLEKDIEDRVCRYARDKGFAAEKFVSPSRRSVPDRIITGPGRKIFYIEFKSKGKKPTVKQTKDHERRRVMGFEVYVVDNVEQGKAIIDMWADA